MTKTHQKNAISLFFQRPSLTDSANRKYWKWFQMALQLCYHELEQSSLHNQLYKGFLSCHNQTIELANSNCGLQILYCDCVLDPDSEIIFLF